MYLLVLTGILIFSLIVVKKLLKKWLVEQLGQHQQTYQAGQRRFDLQRDTNFYQHWVQHRSVFDNTR